MSSLDAMRPAHADDLRHAFDRSFAEPAAAAAGERLSLIAVRLGEVEYAIPTAEIAGLHAGTRITPCPGPLPELVGIAAFRGVLTPVYDLAVLLGHPPASTRRWLVLANGERLALAFDDFGGHLRLDVAAISVRQSSAAAANAPRLATLGDRSWPVIDIASLIAAIRARAAVPPANREL